MISPISEFCNKRKIPSHIKDAFSAYCRSIYADKFALLKDSDTAYLLISRLTQDQLEDAWLGFTKELKRYLTEE